MNLLSNEYRAVLRDTHAERPYWGQGNHGNYAVELANRYQCKSVLDYGCGKGGVVRYLSNECFGIEAQGYDPGVAEFDIEPDPAELVIAFDVMEHVEPEFIGATIDRIRSLATKAAVYKISTVPAKEVLADGRNAHLSVYKHGYWQALIQGEILMQTPSCIVIGEQRENWDKKKPAS